jgi:dihydrofolate reductase
MSKLRVQSFAISIDGYGAGPSQDLEHPLGVMGPELMEWFFPTRVWRSMHGHDDGETGVDNGIAEQGFAGIGAWILGRNMFGPVRGPWPDDSWKGWWGDEPPYHTPVFVLTHHPRAPLRMAGGTEFRFVTDGIHAAFEQATAAANGRCISPSDLSCSVPASTSCRTSMCGRWAMNARSTSRANVRPMSFCASARDHRPWSVQ